jgi:hypothetical protein
MVLKPKRPTLAKTALGWGTLKFRYARTQLDSSAGSLLQHRKPLLILQDLGECQRGRSRVENRFRETSLYIFLRAR